VSVALRWETAERPAVPERADAVSQVAPNLAPPPGNPRFPLFDSLRGIAALSVFVGHTVTITTGIAHNLTLFIVFGQIARQGVAIFFLLSGFLLYRPFLTARRKGRKLTVRGYARRRILRIVPAYWVALTLFIVAGYVSGITAHNWLVFYGFGQVYSFSTIGGGIGAAWTLCTEVTFYAALPILSLIAARFGFGRRSVRGDVALLIVLAAASLVFRAHFSSFSHLAAASTLPGMFLWFAIGMALAIASVTHEDRIKDSHLVRLVTERPTLFWGAALGLSVVLYVVARNNNALGAVATELSTHTLYGLVAVCVLLPGVFGDAGGGVARRVLRLPALAWVGLISYAFYLYHGIVIGKINELALNQHLPARYPVVFVASLLVTCACAAASYYVVERPIMRIRRLPAVTRLGRRSASTHTVDPAQPGELSSAADAERG
jgi:peptidoglycan/LPS O-acetylase OafA/YrhL